MRDATITLSLLTVRNAAGLLETLKPLYSPERFFINFTGGQVNAPGTLSVCQIMGGRGHGAKLDRRIIAAALAERPDPSTCPTAKLTVTTP